MDLNIGKKKPKATPDDWGENVEKPSIAKQTELLQEELKSRIVANFSSPDVDVITVNKARQAKRFRVRVTDNVFTLGKRAYAIDPDRVYFHKNKPVYFFDADQPFPKIMHADMEGTVTATQMYDAIEEKVTSHIIRYAIGADKKLIRALVIGFIAIGLLVGVATYMNMGGMNDIKALIGTSSQSGGGTNDGTIGPDGAPNMPPPLIQ